jgi:hypothetical protein
MGEFDYICSECEGETCHHAKQCEYQPADVIVELPLSDGTTVHVEAHYEGYGYVVIKINKKESYEFYLEQFREYFKDWLIRENEEYRSQKFLCTNIYTVSQEEDPSGSNENARYGQKIMCDYECGYGKKTVKFTKQLLSKCIRADKDLNLPNYLDNLVEDVKTYKRELLEIKPKLEKLKESLSNITETKEYRNQCLAAKKNIERMLNDFKEYLEGYGGYYGNRRFDNYEWWTDSEKEEIENLKKLFKEEKDDEFNKQFEIFRQKYLAKDFHENTKNSIIEEATNFIKRKIYEQEHQINWRNYSIPYNEEKIKEEAQRLGIPVPSTRLLKVVNQ